jgi:hypothetical protein
MSVERADNMNYLASRLGFMAEATPYAKFGSVTPPEFEVGHRLNTIVMPDESYW